MFTRKIYPVLLFTFLTIFITAFTFENSKILIIGDSISIGYTPYIKVHFENRALVEHNQGNAGDTGRGINNIREYLGDGSWDIILFNWGLWDLCYRHPDSKLYGNRDKVNGTLTFTVDEYQTNLDSLVRVMKTVTDARLIFVTTSYVPENEEGRFKKDPKIYNAAAKKVMRKHSVEIYDIYKQSRSIHMKYGIGADDVHYTDEGYQELGKLIIDRLEKDWNKMLKED